MGSSGFEGWTQAQVNAHNARVKAGQQRQDISKEDRVLYNLEAPVPPLNLKIQESTDIQKLNKTERAFYDLLLAQGHYRVYPQQMTLKLADDTRFTVDFVVLTKEGQLKAFETKGFMRDDALVKLKVAARMFPFIQFVLVTREKGVWQYKEVKP